MSNYDNYVIEVNQNRTNEKKTSRGCYRVSILLQDNTNPVTASSSCVQHPLIYVLNPTSLAKINAMSQLQTDLDAYNVDIGFICELWLKDKHMDDLFSIIGFRLIRLDRSKRKGGGVCCYIRSEHTSNVISTTAPANPHHELLWVQIKLTGGTELVCGICYHPSRPLYDVISLTDRIAADLDELCTARPVATICFVDDLNQLNTGFLESDYGLEQMVYQPTHGSKILDKFCANRPDIFENCNVITSTIPTKHKAVLLNCSRESVKQDSQTKRVIQFYNVREQFIDFLNMALHNYNWTHLLINRDLNCVYKAFLDVIQWHINQNIPRKQVTLSSRTLSSLCHWLNHYCVKGIS